MVLAGEQRLALQHLGEDAPGTPNVHFHIVLLPCEHDFWGSVVSCGDIARHLRVLNSREPKVADFKIAVLVDQDIARFQVAVDNSCGMDVFEATLELVNMLRPDPRWVGRTRIW